MKTYFKALVRELVFGGQLMSLGTVSIVATFSLVLGQSLDWKFLLASYLGVHSVYLFDRYRDMQGGELSNQARLGYLSKRKKFLVYFVFISTFGAIFLLSFYGGFLIALATFALLMTGFAYSFFFKPLTKKIIGFKDFFVSFSFLLLLLIFLAYRSIPVHLSVILLLIFIYLRLLTAEIFSDLKDMTEDRSKNLLTFAVVFERGHFYLFIAILNLVSVLPIIYGVIFEIFPPAALALVLIVPYFFWYTHKSKSSDNIALLSYIYCDGEYLLWLPLIIAARHIWG